MTQTLLERATRGDKAALNALLELHREELRRMVAARLDPRLAARVDASDVVQDALLEASRRLDRYLLQRPLPYLAWLRQIVDERIITTHRHHISSQRRSIRREEYRLEVPDESVDWLIGSLFARDTSPSDRAIRREGDEHLMQAVASLPPKDREVVAMRHIEQLSTAAIAAALGISEAAVKSRLVRARARLRNELQADSSTSLPEPEKPVQRVRTGTRRIAIKVGGTGR
jgi:RNA polymerase sigma-70 factor, ECF subfamily